MRYELSTPPFETNNQLANYDPVNSPTTGLVTATSGSIFQRALVQRNDLNFAPRVGLAFQMDPKTVVRAAYGISYQQFLRAATVNELAQNAPFNIDVLITQYAPSSKTSPQAVCSSLSAAPLTCFQSTQAGYLNGLLSPANASPLASTTTYVPARTPTGYVQNYQLSIQRALGADTTLDLAYVGNHGVHEQILTDLNQAAPNAAGGTLSLQARRPITTFGGIQESFNGGPSLFNAFEAKLERRFSHGISFIDSFTYSHAQDAAAANQEVGNDDSPFVDRNNTLSAFTRSAYDVPLRDALAVVYDLPSPHTHRLMGYALGGWQASALNTFSSGLPINLIYSPTTAQQVSSLTSYVYRANLAGNPVLAGASRTRIAAGQYQYLNAQAVSAPTAANTPFGNASRNVARAPNFNDLDFALHKRFPLGFHESALEFRAEAFDVLNHPNAQAPDSNISDSAFGVVSSYFPSRELQFAAKIVF